MPNYKSQEAFFVWGNHTNAHNPRKSHTVIKQPLNGNNKAKKTTKVIQFIEVIKRN